MARLPSAQEDGIDLLKLYAECNPQKWNNYLTKIYRDRDFTEIKRMTYRLDVGMKNLVEQKLDSDKMISFWLRLKRSLEKTGRRIMKELYPHDKKDSISIKQKKLIDRAFETELRKARY